MRADALVQPGYIELLGIKVTHISPDRLTAEVDVVEAHENRFALIHGGVIMAMCDTLGGTATIANLPEGFRTTTIESKTNFFAGVPAGDTAYAECTPLHRGRRTMVWQTRVTRKDGKLCALVTQTQLVIPASEVKASGGG